MSKSKDEAIKDLTLALMYLTRFNNREEPHFHELSWKGYDHETLKELDEADMIRTPSRAQYAYILPDGRRRAMEVIKELGIADFDLYERFDFRLINDDEADEAAAVEAECFPPKEACTLEHMRDRVNAAKEIFLVAVDKETGKMAGFVNGIATNGDDFTDDYFTNASLHDKDGKNIMICGICVRPDYQKQGLARELVYNYCRREWERGRRSLILTCKEQKVKMYKKFGFTDRGEANSSWGGQKWHKMDMILNR